MPMCICFKAGIPISHLKKSINVYNAAILFINIPWIHRTDDQVHVDMLLLTWVFPVHTPDIPREKQMSAPTPRD